MDNENSFKSTNVEYFINDKMQLVEAIDPNQYGLSDYRGGIIVFSTNINALNINKNKILNRFNKKIKTIKNSFFVKPKLNKLVTNFNSTLNKKTNKKDVDDYIGAFSIGNFFSGRYVAKNEQIFDEKSICIEINGISSNGLIYFAEEIAMDFKQETVLVKDLNNNKIYLANSDREGDYDFSKINKKSL